MLLCIATEDGHKCRSDVQTFKKTLLNLLYAKSICYSRTHYTLLYMHLCTYCTYIQCQPKEMYKYYICVTVCMYHVSTGHTMCVYTVHTYMYRRYCHNLFNLCWLQLAYQSQLQAPRNFPLQLSAHCGARLLRYRADFRIVLGGAFGDHLLLVAMFCRFLCVQPSPHMSLYCV